MTRGKYPLKDKIVLLFKRGESLGLPTTYRAIAAATGENANNLRKIYVGENDNPGLRTLEAMAGYFKVSLAYFDCQSAKECTEYLNGVEHAEQEAVVALRAAHLSMEGLKALQDMADHIRHIEASKGKTAR